MRYGFLNNTLVCWDEEHRLEIYMGAFRTRSYLVVGQRLKALPKNWVFV